MNMNNTPIRLGLDRDNTIRLLPPIRTLDTERDLAEINDQLRRELLAWKPERVRRRNMIVAMVASAAALVAFGAILYLVNL